MSTCFNESAIRHPQSAMKPPFVSVVIVNYWRWDDTARVVKQLRADSTLRRGDVEVYAEDPLRDL